MDTMPYKKCSALLETLVNMTDASGLLLVRADLVERITKVWIEVQAASKVTANHNERFEQIFKLLEEKMKQIEQLHVFSLPAGDLKYFAVDIFPNIQVLKLDLCPPSTVKGIYNMRNVLKTLVVTNSGITNMSRTLAPFKKRILRQLSPMIFPDTVFNIPPRYLWANLLTLKLSNCGISKIDESMHFFPSIEHLDLSHNTISHVIHLHDCIDLKYVNFSYNRIRVLSNLERVIGSVTMINLSHNEVESLDGIDRILSLEKLDVSYNRINDYVEVQALCRLPNLEAVRLEGNPLAASQPSSAHYRMRVFRAFIAEGSVMRGDRPFPVLDNVPMTLKERRIFKRVLFRNTTDKEATFTHFDANLLSSTDVLLDQELGGDWGNMDYSEDTEEAEFGDIYAPGEGGQANFSFTSEDPNAAGVMPRPGSRSGGVGDLSSPEATLKGSFASLAGEAGAGSRASRHSVASSGSGTRASPSPGGIASIQRNSRASVDSSGAGRSPMQARMSFNPRSLSTVYSPNTFSPIGTSARQSMYARALSIGGGDPSRASISGQTAPTGVSSPSKRLALRVLQASNAARAGESTAATALRPKRKAHILAAGAQEVYPDLAEVEQGMQEVRERMRAEALALAQARLLEEQARMIEEQSRVSPFALNATTASLSRSKESPVGSYAAGNKASGSLESKYADEAYEQHRARNSASRNSDAQDESDSEASGVPNAASEDVSRRVGVDHSTRVVDGRGAASPLLRGLDSKGLKGGNDMAIPLSASERDRRFSFSSESDATMQSSHNSSLNNLSASYNPGSTDMAAYERGNAFRRGGGVNPLANPRSRGIADSGGEASPIVSGGQREAPGGDDFPPSESARNSLTVRPSEARFGLVPPAKMTYASVAASPRGSEMRAPDVVLPAAASPGHTMDSQNYEEISGPVNTYVGDPDYRNLSVVENMDLYMKEQVFNIKRPSGISPYMRDATADVDSVGIAIDKIADLSNVFIKTAHRYEKFITVFCEKVIDITGVPSAAERAASGAAPLSPPRVSKNRRDQLPRPEEQALAAQEETRYLVLTDTCLYLVRVDFPAQATFSDAPVPTVIRAHKLYSLCTCMIFFGFQRCILGFVDEDQYKDLIYDALAQQAEGTSGNSANAPRSDLVLSGEKVHYQYMILTREKTRTYPLITRINKAANLQRSSFIPIPLSNVLIDNKDFQLVEQVMHCTLSLGGDHDILHYQMAYQVWRKRPGVKLPRTIILTQSLLILCSEELNRPDIHLDVIDTAPLADVQKIYMDDNPLYVTFVLKSNALFAKTRKWRMCTDSRATSTRLQEECRRACAEKGNTGV